MASVIVTVEWHGNQRDLELPADLPIEQLTRRIDAVVGLHRAGPGSIEADPPGRALDPHETLRQAGVDDGAILRLLDAAPAGAGRQARSAAGYVRIKVR